MRYITNYRQIIKCSLILLTVLLMLTALCACGSGQEPKTKPISENTVQPWVAASKQDKDVAEIIKTDGDMAFVEYQSDSTFKSIETGIEHYKDGKLLADESQGTFMLSENTANKGVIGFIFQNGMMSIGQSTIDSSSSTSEIILEGYTEDKGRMFTTLATPTEESQQIEEGKKIYIGAIIQGNEASGDVLDDTEDVNTKGDIWRIYAKFEK